MKKDKSVVKRKNPLVAILIITWNKKHLIDDCLTSLLKKTSYKNFKVIVSDNGSTDGTIPFIKKNFKSVDLIENGENLGFARANNKGIKYSLDKYNPDYVFLLNDDTVITQNDWLERMVEVGESDSKIGIIGCRLIYPDGSLQFYAKSGKSFMMPKEKKLPLSVDDNIIQKIDLNIGATFLIKRSLIERIGLLDPGYFPIYGEEIDYCERAKKNGFTIMYTPKATITHLGSATMNAVIWWKWYLQKRMSIRLELIQYSLGKILYWQLVHFGSVFLRMDGSKIRFCYDFYKRFYFLIKAYFANIMELGTIIHRRRTVHKKLWY